MNIYYELSDSGRQTVNKNLGISSTYWVKNDVRKRAELGEDITSNAGRVTGLITDRERAATSRVWIEDEGVVTVYYDSAINAICPRPANMDEFLLIKLSSTPYVSALDRYNK